MAALVVFTVFAWVNAFASGLAGGFFITLSALAIAFFAATEPRFWVRARTAVLTSLTWWLLLVLVASVVTLIKSGRFDEGGPYGLALVVGVYQGLPIALLAVTLTEILGRLVRNER
jgi:hypothetical protein